jgi:phosphonoacetaldehyde hydrolase
MPREFVPPDAVILDWAGTTVDYGSRAPVLVFMEVFRRRGIEISEAEVRGPMGASKKDHIAALVALPRIAAKWREVFGRDPTNEDIESMYDEFLPLQKETLARCGSDVIPGVADAIDRLRRRGLKIGSTTGYTRELMGVVAPIAARGGYAPDVIVCSDDVSAGRPAPWMNIRAAEQLGVDSMSSVVVVDDTPLGIRAGRNAGAMVVGVSQTGNQLGLSAAEAAALPTEELERRLAEINSQFQAAGAVEIVRSVAELPLLLGIT